MPSVRCSSERCQKVDECIKTILKYFCYGVSAILLGVFIYSGDPDRSCRKCTPYGVWLMLVGFFTIICGVIELASCSFRRCEACENHGSAASAGTGSSSSLVSVKLHGYQNSRKITDQSRFQQFLHLRLCSVFSIQNAHYFSRSYS